jgi:hypothetical protein
MYSKAAIAGHPIHPHADRLPGHLLHGNPFGASPCTPATGHQFWLNQPYVACVQAHGGARPTGGAIRHTGSQPPHPTHNRLWVIPG